MQSVQLECLVPWRIVEYIDVAARARELGCRVPSRIALLPGNFRTAASATEFRYHGATPDVRTAWRSVGLIDGGPDRMPRPGKAGGISASDPNVPLAVFFGAGLCSGPAALLTLALGSVASVLALYPGYVSSREIRLDAVVERPSRGDYVCLEYRGDACELFTLARAVRDIWNGNSTNDRD